MQPIEKIGVLNKTLRTYCLDALGINRYSLRPMLATLSSLKRGDGTALHGASDEIALKSCSDTRIAEINSLSNAIQKDEALEEKQSQKVLSPLSFHSESDLRSQRKYCLAMRKPTDGLLVFSEAVTGDSSHGQLELLKNIIFVVTSKMMRLAQPVIIEWPGRLENENQNLEIRDFFLDFMNNRIALSETRRVLIFGPELKFWLLSDKHIALIKKGRCNLDGGAYVAVLPSLAKMLHNLELKRQAWEVLRARPDLGQAAFTLS
ncbi:MAG: hypothetical protein CMK28_04955 [Porticoccaceae bacterium]|nr:hypothetical protein [Porticoccaceae bacterium]